MDLAGLIAQQATWESHLMNAAEATNQPDATSAGTPLDYSESVYRFYLELADCRPATRGLIEEFLPQHHAAQIRCAQFARRQLGSRASRFFIVPTPWAAP